MLLADGLPTEPAIAATIVVIVAIATAEVAAGILNAAGELCVALIAALAGYRENNKRERKRQYYHKCNKFFHGKLLLPHI